MTHRLVRNEYFFVADHHPNTFDDDGFYDGLLVFGVRLVADGVSVSVLCWTVVLVCDGGGSVCLRASTQQPAVWRYGEVPRGSRCQFPFEEQDAAAVPDDSQNWIAPPNSLIARLIYS